MSLRFRIEPGVAVTLALAACNQVAPSGPPAGSAVTQAPVSALIPAGTPGTTPDPRALSYYDNAEAVTTGMRLYKQMNCAGCHFNGGGGIGPALMDETWIYGGRLDQIYNSIYQGRPNGMPAWRDRLGDDAIWKIAAYVRSMSLPETLAANGSGTPSQHPAPVPQAADAHAGWTLPPGTVGTRP